WMARSATPAQATCCPLSGFVHVIVSVTENCSDNPPLICSVLPVVPLQDVPEQLFAVEDRLGVAPLVPVFTCSGTVAWRCVVLPLTGSLMLTSSCTKYGPDCSVPLLVETVAQNIE